MKEIFQLIITKFTIETLTVSSLVLLLITASIIFYWLYNRKKFHQLSHQIPASVVKNYLDSIIQNSTALKSSLFRGGGLDLAEGIPSVVPKSDLPVTAITSGASLEELNQKNAEIASLANKIVLKDKTIADLENRIRDLDSLSNASSSSEEVSILKTEIQKLRDELKAEKEKKPEATGVDPQVEQQLQAVTKERDELKERLMEYEIIEEDLANLKRLQQENEQLKKSLAALQGGAPVETPPAPVAAEETPVEEAPPAEEPDNSADEMAQAMGISEETPPPAEEPVAEAPAEPEAAGDIPNNEGEQKSAEELLSEFEKMLG